MLRSLVCALFLAIAPQVAHAQDRPATQPGAPVGSAAAAQGASEHVAVEAPVDIITPHITDGSHLEYPCFRYPYVCEYTLPHWEPLHIGGMTVDLSPTKHVVFMLLAALIAGGLL